MYGVAARLKLTACLLQMTITALVTSMIPSITPKRTGVDSTQVQNASQVSLLLYPCCLMDTHSLHNRSAFCPLPDSASTAEHHPVIQLELPQQVSCLLLVVYVLPVSGKLRAMFCISSG